MENKSIIGFIGAGNMAYALIKGLLDNGFDAECINISDPNEELLNERQSELKVRTFSNNMALLSNSDIIIFFVKIINYLVYRHSCFLQKLIELCNARRL